MIFLITTVKARHAWPEKAGFLINRANGIDTDFVFLLFHNEMNITLNGAVVRTKPNAMIVYNKNTPQLFSADEDITHDWIHLRGDLPELLNECNLEFDKIYYPDAPSFITESVRIVENEFFSAGRFSEEIVDLTVRTMLYKVSRAMQDGGHSLAFESENVKKLKALRTQMFLNLSSQHSVAEMASAVNLSESRFYALYREIFGVSPTKDLICARIEKAKDYLDSGLSVSETAYLVGYTNVFHFIRQFKTIVGKTPGVYR